MRSAGLAVIALLGVFALAGDALLLGEAGEPVENGIRYNGTFGESNTTFVFTLSDSGSDIGIFISGDAENPEWELLMSVTEPFPTVNTSDLIVGLPPFSYLDQATLAPVNWLHLTAHPLVPTASAFEFQIFEAAVCEPGTVCSGEVVGADPAEYWVLNGVPRDKDILFRFAPAWTDMCVYVGDNTTAGLRPLPADPFSYVGACAMLFCAWLLPAHGLSHVAVGVG